jgi:DNA modification methylase
MWTAPTIRSLIAAEKTGRHASLIELDPKYVDVIVRRWQDFTGCARKQWAEF